MPETEQPADFVRALFEHLPMGVHFYRLDERGRLIFTGANPSADRILGVANAQFVGRTIEEAFPPLAATEVPERYRCAAETGEPWHTEQVLYEDGRITGAYSVHAFRTGPGAMAATFVDITERKRAQEALRESQELYRDLVETAQDLIWQCDADGRYTFLNHAWEQVLGYRVEQMLGRRFSDFQTPDYAERDLREFGRLLRGNEVRGLETVHRAKDGREVHLVFNARLVRGPKGEVAGTRGSAYDVTERKRAEEEARLNEERLLLAQRVARVGHYVLDAPSGTWTSSGVLDDLFGIGPSYVRDVEGWLAIVHPEDREGMREHLAAEVLGARRAFNREYRIRSVADGSERWVHGVGALEQAPDGRLLRMFGTIQDITERRRAEEERKQLEQQLLHAQKLESLGVLAGGIAHDFNNILMSVLGNAGLALARLNPESPAVENLRQIETAASRAADLARQMLAYSGKGKFVVEGLDLNRLVEDMTHMLQVSVSKKAVLRLNLGRDLPPVEGDATQLRQIVMNLVINASEAIGDRSGVIAVTTGCLACDRRYLSDVWLDEKLPEGLYVTLEVADTGCGMDKDTLARIFDPFFTTKFTGRGLGMAAVLGIVRGHRGAIKVYSEPGHGSTFKVLLPAAARLADGLPASPAEEGWVPAGTVLLVDDEETVRAIGAEMLRALGCTVLTAADGREALACYAKHPEIRAVLLDLTMPHLDGEQTFRELRQLDRGVRVILTSGYNEQEVTHRFSGKGLAAFIQKPYNLGALRAVLRQVLEVPGEPAPRAGG